MAIDKNILRVTETPEYLIENIDIHYTVKKKFSRKRSRKITLDANNFNSHVRSLSRVVRSNNPISIFCPTRPSLTLEDLFEVYDASSNYRDNSNEIATLLGDLKHIKVQVMYQQLKYELFYKPKPLLNKNIIWGKTDFTAGVSYEPYYTRSTSRFLIFTISRTTFKDSGNILLSFNGSVALKSSGNNELVTLLNKIGERQFAIYFDRAKCRYYIKNNRRISYRYEDLDGFISAFKTAKELFHAAPAFREMTKHLGFFYKKPSRQSFYLISNPFIEQLPCFSMRAKLSLYNVDNKDITRKTIDRIRKIRSNKKVSEGHKEKLLIDTFLLNYSFTKRIRKLLCQLPCCTETQYDRLSNYIMVLGVDRVADELSDYVSIIENIDLSRGVHPTDFWWFLSYLALALTGISKQKLSLFKEPCEIKSYYGSDFNYLDERYITDTAQAIHYLKERHVSFDISGIKTAKEIHDYVTKTSRIHRKTEQYVSYTEPFNSRFDTQYYGDYILRPLHNIIEMLTIADEMNHCVDSYMNYQNEGNLEIIMLTNSKGAYLVCIEVNLLNESIMQAKCHNNVPVQNHPNVDLNELVKLWAEEQKLSVRTSDVGFDNDIDF